MNKEPDVRWPAEWEPQDAVWLSWPHRRDLWQGGLDELQQTYGSVAAAIARGSPSSRRQTGDAGRRSE